MRGKAYRQGEGSEKGNRKERTRGDARKQKSVIRIFDDNNMKKKSWMW